MSLSWGPAARHNLYRVFVRAIAQPRTKTQCLGTVGGTGCIERLASGVVKVR